MAKYKDPKKTGRNEKRVIRARLPRLNKDEEYIVRCYVSLKNAILGAIRWLLLNGKVGELVELYHDVTGLQFGTIKLNAKGQVVSDFSYKDYL